jgi:hypothetical protein
MENHLQGAFIFFNLTPLSNFFRYLPRLPYLIFLEPVYQPYQHQTAEVPEGMTAVFLLEFSSCLSTFSPGCRSPPFVSAAPPQKMNGGKI